MPDKDPISIRRLTAEDLPFAQRVRELAGWNQTDRDWERLLAHEPGGCFLASCGGEPAGTATTTAHGGEAGWIGMVLVHPDFRRRGIATRLLRECIGYLENRVRCIKLDATPAGRAVYEKLGFVVESEFARWEGIARREEELVGLGEKSETGIGEDGDELSSGSLAIDREAFGADRRAWLEGLARDSHVAADGEGYAMLRSGSRARYLGPAVARSSEQGDRLVRGVLARAAGEPVYWDIPEDNAAAVALARKLGFVRQRPLVRMRLGKPEREENAVLQWAISGPETG